jgi:hypothetical protein
MSTDLGSQLPHPLMDALREEDVTVERGRAILVITSDESGRAHPALLSYREVGIESDSKLCVVTYDGTSTTKNLRARQNVTLVFVDERFSYYVKGTATTASLKANGNAGLAYFGVVVEQVLEDAPGADEVGAYITSGIEFHNPWDSPRRTSLSE